MAVRIMGTCSDACPLNLSCNDKDENAEINRGDFEDKPENSEIRRATLELAAALMARDTCTKPELGDDWIEVDDTETETPIAYVMCTHPYARQVDALFGAVSGDSDASPSVWGYRGDEIPDEYKDLLEGR